MTRAHTTLAALALACAPACLHGANDLVAEADARVIVTGLAAGDDVVIEVDGDVKRATARGDDPLVVYLDLPPGDHEGRAIFARADFDLCAAFVLHVEAGDGADVDVASVDAATAPRCAPEAPDAGGDADAGHAGLDDAGLPPDDAGSPPDDAGLLSDDAGLLPDDAGLAPIEQLAALVESVDVLACVVEPCSITTTLTADRTIAYTALSAVTLTAQVDALDLAVTSERARSDAADALFAGDDPTCTQPRPTSLLLDVVTLRRDIDPGTGDAVVVQTIEVTGCDEGVARELRLRLQLLRQLTGLVL